MSVESHDHGPRKRKETTTRRVEGLDELGHAPAIEFGEMPEIETRAEGRPLGAQNDGSGCGGLEIAEGVHGKEVQRSLLEEGILVGGSADPQVLRLSPPLTLKPERAALLKDALKALEVPA